MVDGDIIIPGYEPLIPNAVWGRDTKLKCCDLHGEREATSLLHLQVYASPTEDEILQVIQRNAAEFQASRDKAQRTILELIDNFTAEGIDLIAKGDEKVMKRIRGDIPSSVPSEAGVRYLEVIKGTVLNEFFEEHSEELRKFGSSLYDLAIGETAEDERRLKIRLDAPGVLPSADEMKILTDRGVSESYMLSVNRNNGKYADVVEDLRVIYGVLDSAERVGKVENTSAQYAEKGAITTLHNHFNRAAQHSVGMAFGAVKGLVGLAKLLSKL